MLLTVLYTVFVFVCILLIGAVLLQTGRGGGMAGLGGGMGDQVFGAHTANVLQKFTGVCVFLFFFLVIAISKIQSGGTGEGSVVDGGLSDDLKKATQAQQQPAPSPTGKPATNDAPAPKGIPNAPVQKPAKPAPAPAAPAKTEDSSTTL